MLSSILRCLHYKSNYNSVRFSYNYENYKTGNISLKQTPNLTNIFPRKRYNAVCIISVDSEQIRSLTVSISTQFIQITICTTDILLLLFVLSTSIFWKWMIIIRLHSPVKDEYKWYLNASSMFYKIAQQSFKMKFVIMYVVLTYRFVLFY